jgi:hypothetical protein
MINIEELSGPWSFVKQACRTFWKHKGWYLAFAALPIILSLIPNFYAFENIQDLGKNPTVADLLRHVLSPNNLFSYACLFLIAPLFAIAWNQHLLNPDYKPSLQSYLKLDAKYFKYLAYNILIMLVFAVTAMTLTIATLFIIETLAQFMISIQVLPILITVLSIFIITIAIFGIFYLFLPLHFVLIAISIGQKLTFGQVLKNSKIYRKNLLLSFILFLVVGGIVYLAASVLAGVLFGLTTKYFPAIPFNVLLAIFSGVAAYVFMGPLLTLYALYYKKHLMH